MGAGIHGGFGGTNGSLSGKGKSQSLPTKEAQLKHIFSGKNGRKYAAKKILNSCESKESREQRKKEPNAVRFFPALRNT